MKPRFTQGPWVLTFDGKSVLSISDKGVFVKTAEAFTASFEDGTGTHEITEDQAKSNARLIAAAPELYDLLDQINAAFYTRTSRKQWLELMEKTKPLLRKARGEE